MSNKQPISTFLGIAAAVVLATNARAATPINILTNPGFETGDFAGWTVGGNSIQVGVDTDGTVIPNADPPFLPNFVNVRSGTYAGHALIKDGMDPVERIILSQTVSVLPNNNVDVGFWLGNDSASVFGVQIDDDHLQIFIDGVGLLPNAILNVRNGSSPADFHLFSANFNTGSRTSITVDFAINGSGTSRVGASFDDFFFITEMPPSATGACCLPDFSCQDLTESECAAAGGLFFGDGTECTTTDCPVDCSAFPCGNNNKVLLCHVPPGNPANAHTICISPKAVAAHLENHEGDHCGPCDGPLLQAEVGGGDALPPCPTDIDLNGVTNVLDLIDLLLCFGEPAVPGCESEDTNLDGTINVLDLIDLLLAFGTVCP